MTAGLGLHTLPVIPGSIRHGTEKCNPPSFVCLLSFPGYQWVQPSSRVQVVYTWPGRILATISPWHLGDHSEGTWRDNHLMVRVFKIPTPTGNGSFAVVVFPGSGVYEKNKQEWEVLRRRPACPAPTGLLVSPGPSLPHAVDTNNKYIQDQDCRSFFSEIGKKNTQSLLEKLELMEYFPSHQADESMSCVLWF